MMYRMSEEDEKKSEEIRKWLTFDADNNRVLRDDTPEYIRKERERLAKKYFPL